MALPLHIKMRIGLTKEVIMDMKQALAKKQVSLVPKNCGIVLRSRKESLNVIREHLEQLRHQGQGESHLARVYENILKTYEK
jgi:type II secretory pathway component GspD/PulD (secretin)